MSIKQWLNPGKTGLNRLKPLINLINLANLGISSPTLGIPSLHPGYMPSYPPWCTGCLPTVVHRLPTRISDTPGLPTSVTPLGYPHNEENLGYPHNEENLGYPPQ